MTAALFRLTAPFVPCLEIFSPITSLLLGERVSHQLEHFVPEWHSAPEQFNRDSGTTQTMLAACPPWFEDGLGIWEIHPGSCTIYLEFSIAMVNRWENTYAANQISENCTIIEPFYPLDYHGSHTAYHTGRRTANRFENVQNPSSPVGQRAGTNLTPTNPLSKLNSNLRSMRGPTAKEGNVGCQWTGQ